MAPDRPSPCRTSLAHRASEDQGVRSAKGQRSIEMLAGLALSHVRTFRQHGPDNNRGSSVGTAPRRLSGGSLESALIDKRLLGTTDWLAAEGLGNRLKEAASFEAAAR